MKTSHSSGRHFAPKAGSNHVGFLRRCTLLAIFSVVFHAADLRAQRQNIVEYRGFETGDLSEWKTEGGAKDVVTSPTRAGKYAGKFTLTKDEERTEVTGQKVSVNAVYWYGWSLQLPANFPLDGSKTNFDAVTQFHFWQSDTWYKGSPTFLKIDDNNWNFKIVYQPDPSVRSTKSKTIQIDGIAGDRGKWTDWVMQARWSYKSDGFIKLWKNGKLVVDHQGSTYFDLPRGPYFKMGIYKGNSDWPGTAPRTIYGDEYRLGSANATYRDVAPSGEGNPSGGGSTKLSVASATASANDGNVPANTLDGKLSTRWSADGQGQWIQYDLGRTQNVESLKIAFYKGDQRKTSFEVLFSADAATWTKVFAGQSSGGSTALETFDLTDGPARYVRLVGQGNSDNDWNSLTETEIYGTPTAAASGRMAVERPEAETLPTQEIRAVPNPSRGSWQISMGATWTDARLTVTDAAGRVVISQPSNPSGKGTFAVDLTNRADGVYLLRLTKGSRSLSKRLVKNRDE